MAAVAPAFQLALLSISASDIERALEPYVLRRFEGDERAWLQQLEAMRRGARAKLWRARLRNWLRGSPKQVARVHHDYSRIWALEQMPGAAAVENARYLMRWRNRGLEVRGWAEKRVHLLLFSNLLQSLRPASVLEVGSGSGMVLMMLATGHPGIHFTGIELTETGVQAAQRLQAAGALPQAVLSFVPFPVADEGAYRRVEFRQGNAAALPWSDGSFDVAMTSLALEQMNQVRREALTELARVARRLVVMLEPFRDFNLAPEQRYHTRAHDYFAAAVADLPKYGLRPLHVFDDFPSKVNRGVGLVVAEPVRN
jgi:SAM-dependent methyltransferase